MNFFLDGILFRDVVGTAEMREVFAESSFIETFLEVESALARAEAEAGVIPESAALEITQKASLEYVNMEEIERNIQEIGKFTMSIIEAWKESFDGAGEFIHWGATSMDVSDTTQVLQIREAFDLIESGLREVRDALADLAETYRDAPMMGRTHSVHAVPITAGLKFATWLDEIHRHEDRLADLRERLFVLECFGATGTMASIEDAGLEVQRLMAAELDLDVPDTAWFAARDRFVEFLQTLAGIGGTLSKISRQLLVLNRPEIDEVDEPIPEGTVGSSTMPHKRNPERTEFTVALNRLIRANTTVMTEGLVSLDERDWSLFPEFIVVPTTSIYLHRMLYNTRDVLEGLEVDGEAMKRNLGIFGSSVTSEPVMMALADSVGRQTAHEIIHEIAMSAYRNDESFAELLKTDERVTAHLSATEIDELTDPQTYTGLARAFVDRTVEQ